VTIIYHGTLNIVYSLDIHARTGAWTTFTSLVFLSQMSINQQRL